MANIELKIDGEVIVLTSQQTAQLKRAVEKETFTPPPKQCGTVCFSCKKRGEQTGKHTAYPFVLSSCSTISDGTTGNRYGRDFSLAELKGFIRDVKAYASLIWTTAEKELKDV